MRKGVLTGFTMEQTDEGKEEARRKKDDDDGFEEVHREWQQLLINCSLLRIQIECSTREKQREKSYGELVRYGMKRMH